MDADRTYKFKLWLTSGKFDRLEWNFKQGRYQIVERVHKIDDETLWYRVYSIIQSGPSVEAEGLVKNRGYLVAHKTTKYN